MPESGILASGAIVSLLDTAGGASVWMALGHFQPIVTIDLRLDYLRPAIKGETVIARCECYKLTRAIGFVRGSRMAATRAARSPRRPARSCSIPRA